ncbi:MAG: hypothetical protein GY788_22350 [bacterium]|nr:hypothetical protein [bacterium]
MRYVLNKTRFPLTLALACLSLAALAGPAAAEFPMQCAGGGDMTANYYPEHGYIEVHFRKAPQGANVAAPGAGECAWMDRPVNDAEPFWFRYSLPGNQRITRFMFGPGSGGVLGSSPPPAAVGGHSVGLIMDVSGHTLSALIDAINSGRRFTIQAGATGQNYFAVSQILF